MPAKHRVESITFDPNTVEGFVLALQNIGFAVTEKQTEIDDIHYTHHAKWMSAPFNDGIYFKYYESEYTPLYTYTYTAEQTYSGTTYDENKINEWRELYPDTFEILNVEDHTSCSFIVYRLSKDNRDYENVMIEWTPSRLMSTIVGTDGDSQGATTYRILSKLGNLVSNTGPRDADISSVIHKIPYVKTSNGGIIVLSLTYYEVNGSARWKNKLPFAFLPPDNSKDQWTSVFFGAGVYVAYYMGDTIWQSDALNVGDKSGNGITLLKPLESLRSQLTPQPAPAQGHFYNANVFITNHYKLDHKIFSVKYGSTVGYSMGEIHKDTDNNEYYIFSSYDTGSNTIYGIKL